MKSKVRKGDHITVESGADHDVYVEAFAVVSSDFDINSEWALWLLSDNVDMLPAGRGYVKVKRSIANQGMRFGNWLESKGLVKIHETIDIHTGSYGELEMSISSN